MLVALLCTLAAGCSSPSGARRDAMRAWDGGADSRRPADALDAAASHPDRGSSDALAPHDASNADATRRRDAAAADAQGDGGADAELACAARRPAIVPASYPLLAGTALRVTAVAGGASSGATDGSGAEARFHEPRGLASDGAGTLYVSECQNHLLRRVEVATWRVTTLAGGALQAGSLDGTGGAARFRCPSDLAVADGILYVADTDNSTIRRVKLGTREVTTLVGKAGEPGSADGPFADARLNHPSGIAARGELLWVADSGNHTLRRLDLRAGEVTTVAGTAGVPGLVDGAAGAARFYGPRGLSTDGSSLYVADSGNNAVRRLELASGVVSTLAGGGPAFAYGDGSWDQARFFAPIKLVVDGGVLWLADTNNRVIRRLDLLACSVSTPAGTAGVADGVDGVGMAARFSWPEGLVRVSQGLVVADMLSHRLRLLETP